MAKSKRFVVLTEYTDRQDKVRINIVKYGLEKQEVVSQQPSHQAAQTYCKKHGLTVVGEQPELFTPEKDTDLTPFQRRILNRHAAQATLRRHGYMD